MKALNGKKGGNVCNIFVPREVWQLAVVVAFLALAKFVDAQIFYVSEGASGLVAKVSSGGLSSTLANIGGDAQGITTDSLGNIYVARGSSIYQITPGGSSSLFATYANSIGGITMHDGTLYGVSTAGGPSGGHNVGTFNSDGTFTALTLTTSPFVPFYPSQSLKFDSAGNIFVTNSGNGGAYGESVLKLAPSGSVWNIASFVSYSTGTFQPFDVATDLSGNVFVSSGRTASGTVVKYNSSGVLDTSFTLSGTPDGTTFRGLTYANDKLYAVALGSYKLFEIDPNSGLATAFNSGNLPDYRNTYVAYSAVPEPSQTMLILMGGLTLLFFQKPMRATIKSLQGAGKPKRAI